MSKWIAIPKLDGHLSFPVQDEQGRTIGGANALAAVKSGYGEKEDAYSWSVEGQPEAWANAQLFASAPALKAERDRAVALLREITNRVIYGGKDEPMYAKARAFLKEVENA